jgi:hypothetical protein
MFFGLLGSPFLSFAALFLGLTTFQSFLSLFLPFASIAIVSAK